MFKKLLFLSLFIVIASIPLICVHDEGVEFVVTIFDKDLCDVDNWPGICCPLKKTVDLGATCATDVCGEDCFNKFSLGCTLGSFVPILAYGIDASSCIGCPWVSVIKFCACNLFYLRAVETRIKKRNRVRLDVNRMQ